MLDTSGQREVTALGLVRTWRSCVDSRSQPEVGEAAPSITATTATGDSFDLADLLGSYVVIWFFPRAMTPG